MCRSPYGQSFGIKNPLVGIAGAATGQSMLLLVLKRARHILSKHCGDQVWEDPRLPVFCLMWIKFERFGTDYLSTSNRSKKWPIAAVWINSNLRG